MLWRLLPEIALISVLSDGQLHASEQLRERLGISCAEIYKHVKIIQEWGVDVSTVLDNSYRLSEPIHFLNETLIQKQIKKNSVTILPVIDSTNQYLLDRLDTLCSGDVCLAEYQRAGRGRRGRKWFSPFGLNICLSMYWCFKERPSATIGLSLVIAIMIAIVLHDFGANQVKVKWPNDLYLFDRKLAGILVELTGKTDSTQVVIGTGINLALRSSSREEEIDQHWINLQEIGVVVDRNIFVVRLIKELLILLERFEQHGLAPFLPTWNKLDNFINRPVKLLIGDQEIYGISRGINEQGALLLEQNGIVKPWVRGEISLRNVNS